jgi:hypothetical protein
MIDDVKCLASYDVAVHSRFSCFGGCFCGENTPNLENYLSTNSQIARKPDLEGT